MNSNIPSSPDSSSDSSTSSPQHPYDGPNVEAENSLPGVVSTLLLVKVLNPVNSRYHLSIFIPVLYTRLIKSNLFSEPGS